MRHPGDDLWDAAVKCAQSIAELDRPKGMSPVVSAALDDLVKRTIKRAILLERHRAAEVARVLNYPEVAAMIAAGMDKEFWDD